MNTIIVGAGAGGLACAIRLKMNNPKENVTILERLEKPGKKLLATGNGRCNLSNENALGHETVIDFFSSLGLSTVSDEEGRIYPRSNRSDTVLQIMLDKCQNLGINIICDCVVKEITSHYKIITSKGDYTADRVVIATGGLSQKSLGSYGDGYSLLEKYGHSKVPTYPALVQLKSSSKYPRMMKGQRIKCNVAIELDGENVKSEYGEVLFTDYGLSGIVIMNLSDAVSENFCKKEPKKCVAVLDLTSDLSESELISHYEKFGSFDGILGQKLSHIIESQSGGDYKSMAKIIKSWRLIITGTKGFDFAQITKGGIKESEFCRFESKKSSGLYAIGEVLENSYKCGGYNLNFAFLSGITAADNIFEESKNNDKN